MVFEWLLQARKDRKHPLNIFIFSAIISIVALFISYSVFKESTGLFTVVLISLVTVPFINSMLRYEEIETEQTGEREGIWQRHGDVIIAFAAMFLGMTISMSVAYVILPEQVANSVFNEQIKEIEAIQASLVGRFFTGTTFVSIIANNFSVLVLSFVFSFLFGTGAILILAWNASVLSAAIGSIANSAGGLRGIPIGILTFLPHGTFELTAYFVGAIAGGLISMAIWRKKSPKFSYIIKDSLLLLVISFALLIIGGFVEAIILG